MAADIQKVMFAGGGTGGHIYMAIAIAEFLQKAIPSCELLFVGARAGLESRILPSQGFKLQTIEIGGLKRVGVKATIRTLLQLLPGLLRARRIVKKFAPSLMVGMGGYASGLFMLAGRLLGTPLMLIEPNAYPGFTNRALSRLVDRAAVAYDETAQWFGDKAVVTGIPVRQAFFDAGPYKSSENPLQVLAFGGSNGSVPINTLLCQALPFLSKNNLRIVHQTGPSDHQRVLNQYATHDYNAEITGYIEDMPAFFSNADLIVSRAGASTVAEITASGRASLLLPFPQAADDHQRKNAEALASRGAAIVLDQGVTSPEDLALTILALEQDRGRLVRMAEASKQLARPDSLSAIFSIMKAIAK